MFRLLQALLAFTWNGALCFLIMAALCNRGAIIILPCDFYLSSSSFFFSSPNLSGHRLDLYHTSTHGVALVRIYNAGLKCAARGSFLHGFA